MSSEPDLRRIIGLGAVDVAFGRIDEVEGVSCLIIDELTL
jgi:hypothetical protein